MSENTHEEASPGDGGTRGHVSSPHPAEADPVAVAVGKGAFEVCGQLGAVDELVQGLQGAHHLTLPREGTPLGWLAPARAAIDGLSSAPLLVPLTYYVWLDTGTKVGRRERRGWVAKRNEEKAPTKERQKREKTRKETRARRLRGERKRQEEEGTDGLLLVRQT